MSGNCPASLSHWLSAHHCAPSPRRGARCSGGGPARIHPIDRDDRERDQDLDQREAAPRVSPNDAALSLTANGPMPSVTSVSRWSSRRRTMRARRSKGSGPRTTARADRAPRCSRRASASAAADRRRADEAKPLPSAARIAAPSAPPRPTRAPRRVPFGSDTSRVPRARTSAPPGRAETRHRRRDRDHRDHHHQLDQCEARRAPRDRCKAAPTGPSLGGGESQEGSPARVLAGACTAGTIHLAFAAGNPSAPKL